MEKTAVEWLIEQVKSHKYIEDVDLEQAKEMEKKQIIDAWNKNPQGFNHSGEKYYNETFNK